MTEEKFKRNIQLDRPILAASDLAGYRGVTAYEKNAGFAEGYAHRRLAWFRRQSANYQNKVRAANAAEKEPARMKRRVKEILFKLDRNKRNLRDVRAEAVRIDVRSIELRKQKTALKQSRACLKASLEKALDPDGKR